VAGGGFRERAVARGDGSGAPPLPRSVGEREGLRRGRLCFGRAVGDLLDAVFSFFSPIFAIGRDIGSLLDLL
jgi:hypothetical protein